MTKAIATDIDCFQRSQGEASKTDMPMVPTSEVHVRVADGAVGVKVQVPDASAVAAAGCGARGGQNLEDPGRDFGVPFLRACGVGGDHFG